MVSPRVLLRSFPGDDQSDDAEASSGDSDGDDENGDDESADSGREMRESPSSKTQKAGRKQDRARSNFQAQCLLTLSVALWVAVFGLPMYSINAYTLIFGWRGATLLNTVAEDMRQNTKNMSTVDIKILEKLRITCGPNMTGRMRNIAGPYEQANLVPWKESMGPWNSTGNLSDIWCGVLSQNYLDYWPNVAQLIIFTVYKNTGTTINLAWQGVIGTFCASLNVFIMQLIYPQGGAAYECISPTDIKGKQVDTLAFTYTVIWHAKGQFQWRFTGDLDKAKKIYSRSDNGGGLDARAIIAGNGNILGEHWFLNEFLRNATLEKFYSLRGEECERGSLVHFDENYNEWVCLVDVIGVLALFLISGSARNTIMFGMSWHVTFMMDFMNPQIGVTACKTWDCIFNTSVYAAVLQTTIIGAFIAILATMSVSFCAPITNFKNLYEDSLAMTTAVVRIWRESIAYLNGSRRSAKRFQLEMQISNLSSSVAMAQEHADGAWWETCGIGQCGASRRLLMQYNESTSDIRDMMNCVQDCVLSEDFKGGHAFFASHLRASMEELQEEAAELMYQILQACSDGTIDKHEAETITGQTRKVMERQRVLVKAFHEASPDVSEDLAEENIFAFALSFWARKMTDFGTHIATFSEADKRRCGAYGCLRNMCFGLKGTWSPRKICELEHLKFCCRNLVSISLTYCIACFMASGSIFVQYSPVMPATLTLLLVADGSHQIGSMIYKNTHRLLGVTLGKVLPVIITWALFFYQCLSTQRFCIQFIAIGLYVYLFTYIYYVSPMWGYVGCLISGFGVYQLMAPCSQDLQGTFQTRYQEIGAVTFAICVQAILHALMSWHSPQELIVQEIRGLSAAIAGGYEALFSSDLQAMKDAAVEVEAKLHTAKVLLPECDPKLKVMSCAHKDFRYELCACALKAFESVLGHIDLLIVAAKDWVPNESVRDGENMSGVLQMLNRRQAMQAVQSELMQTLSQTMQLLQDSLEHRERDGELEKVLEDLTAISELESAPELYKQLSALCHSCGPEHLELTNDIRARLTIAARALQNTKRQFFLIKERCLKELDF